jgi:hypothetical protein
MGQKSCLRLAQDSDQTLPIQIRFSCDGVLRRLGEIASAQISTTPTHLKVADCARRGIDRHADRLLKNETRPVYDSGHNRCNVLARLVMERLQVVDTAPKKF